MLFRSIEYDLPQDTLAAERVTLEARVGSTDVAAAAAEVTARNYVRYVGLSLIHICTPLTKKNHLEMARKYSSMVFQQFNLYPNLSLIHI